MKGFLRNSILFAAACAFSLALGELLARQLLPPPHVVEVRIAADVDERLRAEQSNPARFSLLYLPTESGRRLRANAHVTIRSHALNQRWVEIRTNSLGYRNPEIGEKTGTRILFLGDSITFGDFLPEEETFVRLVETFAAERGERWETINAGVGAINLKNELAILLETGLRTEPDVVVLGFYLNDFQESPGVYVPQLPDPLARSWLAHHVALAASHFLSGFERGRSVVDAVNQGIDLATWRRDFERDFPAVPGDPRRSPLAFNALIQRNFGDWGGAWSHHAWEAMEPIFGEFKRLSQLHGFTLVVVSSPPSSPNPWEPRWRSRSSRSSHWATNFLLSAGCYAAVIPCLLRMRQRRVVHGREPGLEFARLRGNVVGPPPSEAH